METHIPRIPNNSNATPVEIPAKPKVAGMEQTQQITPEMRKAIPIVWYTIPVCEIRRGMQIPVTTRSWSVLYLSRGNTQGCERVQAQLRQILINSLS